ncbi:MAG: MFS transporter [Clostridia bacterium]|nr:MFS transporter [Clostridia bacterium]
MKKNMFKQAQLRPFLWLWASQSISAMGTAMTDYALVIWAYEQTQTATSLTLLTLCSFLPTILFRFLAGAAADKWNKKAIMLAADAFAACGSLLILSLYIGDALSVMWLYGINFLLSLMNAFQVPAAYVATSLLVPKEYYTRTGGLQAVSGALISILSPVLGSVLLSFGGLEAVLAADLATFLLAFVTLASCPFPCPNKRNSKRKKPCGRRLPPGSVSCGSMLLCGG